MLSYIIRKPNVLKNAVIEINCHHKAVIKIAIGNRDNAYTDGHVFFLLYGIAHFLWASYFALALL